jgi:formate hydrogenlyase transcriptional activator
MSGTVQRAAETAVKRYEALLRVSQTLISTRSSEELFKLLARELRSVVSFYVMGVGIYDENAHEMRTTSYGEPSVPLQVQKFAPEETFSWWAYQHQQPLIISSLDAETRFPAVVEMLKKSGVRSVCALPLTTVHRRLGGLAVGSLESDAYSAEEVSFLSLVANQVALAVDDALNFDASQHAKEALRAREESFRGIVDSMPAFAWYASPDGKLEYLNQRILDFTAERQENLVGFGWANVLHPEDVERTKKAWLHSVETGEPCEVDQRVRRFDNIYRWFRTTAQPLRDASGRVIRWYGVATEIEDWKRAEESLRASEQSLRLIVDSIPGLVATTNAAGEPESFNRQLLEYFGRTTEELKNWATGDIVHPHDHTGLMGAHIGSIETGNPYNIEIRIRRADGAYRWFQVRNHPLRDTEGHVLSWYVLLTDIDDRKHAEEALRASEVNLGLVVGSIPGLVNTMTAEGENEFVNQQVLEYFGKSHEELNSWATSDLVHPDDLPRVIAAFTSSIETGQPYDTEHRLRRADGVYRWFQVRARPLRDTAGRIIRWYVLSTDIDERKQAEDRLQLLLDVTNQVVSNLQLRDLLQAISASVRRVMQCDLVGVFLPDSEADRMQTFMLDFPESKGFIREEYCSMEGSLGGFVFRSGKPWTGDASDVLKMGLTDDPVIPEGLKTGCMVPLVSRNRVLGLLGLGRREENAFSQADLGFLTQVASQIAIAIENTSAYRQVEQARAELENALGEIRQQTEALRRSEGYLAEAQKLNHTGSWAWDVRTRDAFWSQEMFKILGYEPEKTKPSLSHFMERVHPEDRPMVERVVKREMTGSDLNVVSDYRIVLPDRTQKHLHVIAHPVTSGSGEVIEVIGTSMDVTEQVEARNKLEKAFAEIKLLKDQLHKENLALRDEVDGVSMFEEVVGSSPALKVVLDSVRIVAPADSTVLIQGETGTGKEMIARAIHNLSPRKGQAFVKVNCAAIPLGLLESELFGHERGAFTGAIAQKVGRFELAHKGTLFLDEVGDIPLELQPKLLRVLQEQEFERLGSTRTQRVDVRVLAATNASLTQMVAEKKFRSDLYYRLNVFPIDVPPLRDRREDIPLLVRYFANKYARRIGKHIESIPKEAMDTLSHYAWPGNIRELQNLMERATLLSTGPSLRVPLAEILIDSGPSAAGEGNALEQAEREQIVRALRESNWVVGGARGAAARLGLKRTSLAYKMQKLGISRPPQ